MSDQEKCKNCEFSKSMTWNNKGREQLAPHGLECRKLAPVIFEKEGFGFFPRVHKDRWCGEYQPDEMQAFYRQEEAERPAREARWKLLDKNTQGYPPAAWRLLVTFNIDHPSELCNYTRKEALSAPRVGEVGLKKLEAVMAENGIMWKDLK